MKRMTTERRARELETPDGEARRRHDWRPSMHSGFGTLVVLAPIFVVVTGTALDRSGYSALGITLTFIGGVSFLVMLAVVAWWG